MRLIDADALIDRLKFKRRLNGNVPDKCAGYDSAIAQANKLPTIDTVEVTRCKDCVYYQQYDDFKDEWCTYPRHAYPTTVNDYCSHYAPAPPDEDE